MNQKTLALTAVLAIMTFVLIYAVSPTLGPSLTNISPSVFNTTSQTPVTAGDTTTPGSLIHDLPVPEAVAAVRTYAAAQYGVSESNVLILLALESEWPDSCLGLARPEELCLQVITPGYVVQVQINGTDYFYRTNETSTVIRVVTRGSANEPDETEGTKFAKLHQPCTDDSDCDPGVQCVDYYGIAGPGGPLFQSCEIRCTKDSDCPSGLVCGAIADGPGQVCM